MDTEEPKMKKDEENENKVENKRKKVTEKIINFSEKKTFKLFLSEQLCVWCWQGRIFN